MNVFAITLLVYYGLHIAAAIIVMALGKEKETKVIRPKQDAIVTFFGDIFGLLMFLAAIGIL